MIPVSDAWKALHNETILPESFVEITCWITEPGAQELIQRQEYEVPFYAESAPVWDTADKNFQKYATLENNLWALDGTFKNVPDNEQYGDTGLVSDRSDLTITLAFDEVRTQSIPGITVVWSETYGEYATKCTISAFDDNNQRISTKTYTNDSTTSQFDLSVSDYRTIKIRVLEWSIPDHRPRVERVYLGLREVFTKSDLVSYSHTQSADLMSAQLPKNQITFSIDNSTRRWDYSQTTGMAKHIAERQELSVRYGYKMPTGEVEWIPAGTFWIAEWSIPSNGLEATFVARDIFEFLDVKYTGPRSGTLYDIAMAALSQEELPVLPGGGLRYQISESESLQMLTDFTEDTTEYSVAVILQMVANAGRCVLFQDRFGILRIAHHAPFRMGKYETDLDVLHVGDYRIGRNISYTYPEVIKEKAPQSIDINGVPHRMIYGNQGVHASITNPAIWIWLIDNTEDTAKWIWRAIMQREIMSGSFRPDPRVDLLDIFEVEDRDGLVKQMSLTEITYNYNGAFKAEYVGRRRNTC